MLMPFGRHKGEEVADLPRRYLLWLKRTVKLYGDLQEEVEAILSGKSLEPKESFDTVLQKLQKMGLMP